MKIDITVGEQRIYNENFKDKEIIKWEVLDIENGQNIKLSFIDSKSIYRQGIWFATDKGIKINGMICPQIDIWKDTAPQEIILKCHTSNGKLSLYNIWDDGSGRESQSYTSGILIKQIGNTTYYYCNDYGLETDFNKLVFSIEKL